MKKFIPIARPYISSRELNNVITAVKSSWISSTGAYIDQFEKAFAETVGTRFAVSTSSGTAALHLALLALGIGPGDEVIVPALTFVATANVVAYTGAKVILVDVEQDSWNIDPEKAAQKITRKTRAIIPVHLYGYPAQMDMIMKLARLHHIAVIEDAAEAHGATIRGKQVGAIGDAGCFSFYGNKIITTGEGGMITTNNTTLMKKIQLFKNHGMSPAKKYWHPVVGYNYRMTNIQAAIGLAQLAQFKKFLKQRRQIAQWYREDLHKIKNITLPPTNTLNIQGVNWLFTVLLKENAKKNRDELIKFLATQGIDSRPMFYPLSHFPMYKTREKFPVTEELSRTGITLPTYIGLSKKDITRITRQIASYAKT